MNDIEIAQLLDRLMRRVHAALTAKAPEFDTHKVGPGGGILLLTLAEIEPARVQELVRRMSRDKSQMTRAIQALERKGLIQRREDPLDARASLLALTDEGRETVAALQRAVAEVLAGILAPLHESGRRELRDLLRRL